MHIPVLFQESINALLIKKDGVYVDGTLGGASHALEIAKHLGPDGTLIGFDLDSNAVARAEEKLSKKNDENNGVKCKVILVQENFRNLDVVLAKHNISQVNGIFLDLGWSSFQMTDPPRGFSFQVDGPLQMTLKDNPGESDITAYDIVNKWEEKTIADVLYMYGNERYSRIIARKIVEARSVHPIETTLDLADLVASCVPNQAKKFGRSKSRINPATKTFQALRIAVNDEYGALKETLEKGFELLKSGGRFAVITFHSGEDRIVKNYFRDQAHADEATLITKKPIMPSDTEVKENPRSRSAQLRVLEKS
jgi:16S rRNA (cytosine1402-N4)-methyltransferase